MKWTEVLSRSFAAWLATFIYTHPTNINKRIEKKYTSFISLSFRGLAIWIHFLLKIERNGQYNLLFDFVVKEKKIRMDVPKKINGGR